MYRIVLVHIDNEEVRVDSMEFSNMLEVDAFKRGADMRLSMCSFEYETEHYSAILEKYEKIDVEEFLLKSEYSMEERNDELKELAEALDYDSSIGHRLKDMLEEGSLKEEG